MSRQYGPQTVAIGVPMKFPVGKNAANIYVRNRSPFILRVWFGSDAPGDTAPTTAWHADVGPWEGAPLGVLGGYTQAFRNISTYANPSGFDGTVTLVPVQVGAAVTTAVSTSYSVTLTSYEAAEAVPQPSAAGTAQATTTGNQRVISVPMVPSIYKPQYFSLLALNTPVSLASPPLGYNFADWPGPAANGAVDTYLYSLRVQADQGGWFVVEVRWYVLSITGVPTGTFVTSWIGGIDSTSTRADHTAVHHSPYPLWQVLIQAGAGPKFGPFAVITNAANPGTTSFYILAALGFDPINGAIPAEIGGIQQPWLSTPFTSNPGTF